MSNDSRFINDTILFLLFSFFHNGTAIRFEGARAYLRLYGLQTIVLVVGGFDAGLGSVENLHNSALTDGDTLLIRQVRSLLNFYLFM